jgi:hypothetical protein
MRELIAVTILAAAVVALATQSAAACDWNREASTAQQQVATSPAPAEPTAPIVRVNDRN